ncbi:MAG TPA: hypothetical protein DEW31_02455 [Alistipes obesi]|nr:hypothetical protein [Alistipes communis]
MLEKLAKQTAVYGISTIAVRFLSYLLTPVFTRVFEPEAYGIVTDVYALIPFALVVLTMGLESAYFRFAAKADAAAAAAGGTEGGIAARARAGKRRLFATAWGVTLLAASLFFLLTAFGRERVAEWMGEAYVAHPEYVLLVAAVVWFDVAACLPFSRLREQGRAMTFVGIKALGVVVNVALAIGFALAGLYGSPFGVGWVFVANLIASAVTFNVILLTTDRTVPRIDRRLLAAVLVYSLPLLVSGVAGTANEFIDRQMIKYLVPAGAMAQLGVYGAITKIAVVMMLFTQMYRLAAEPFFLADYRKSDFVAMNAAAMKYYVMASMFIFLGIALFKDLFSLIVGADFREGIFILPVVLGANVLSGVWLNLSFWYKREERTQLAVWVTFTGLFFTVVMNVALVPALGYVGAAWARLASEAAMVGVSYWLNRRYYPTPYDLRRIGEYVALGLGVFFASAVFARWLPVRGAEYAVNGVLFGLFGLFAVRREHIDVGRLLRSVVKR